MYLQCSNLFVASRHAKTSLCRKGLLAAMDTRQQDITPIKKSISDVEMYERQLVLAPPKACVVAADERCENQADTSVPSFFSIRPECYCFSLLFFL